MKARGLLQLAKDVVSPARREIGLNDLRRQPAANDNFELDPLDVADMALSLGEAAPAALFLFPMWAAASAYLKDPQYYLNKHRTHCGEPASKEKHRPFEWQPMIRPMMPSHHDYRNPSLTDTERQKLVEWFQTEKSRGAYRGAEGLPKGLPQDPPRDDTYATPIDLRNMVVDTPREDALPATERALPDLQQNDDHRRLMMGDAIPGRERMIGDVLQDGAPQIGARDFLAPVSEKESTQDEQRGITWLPDFRMGILDRGGKLPSGGSQYSAQFRERLKGADTVLQMCLMDSDHAEFGPNIRANKAEASVGPVARMSGAVDNHRLARPLGHQSYSNRFRKANVEGNGNENENGQSIPPTGHEVPSVTEPQAPNLQFELHRQFLTELFKAGSLTVRQIYGKTVIVSGKKVTLRSVLGEFWRLRREQMIAEGKLGTDIDTDALSENALDIICFDLTGKLRPHSRWNKKQRRKLIPLQIPPNQFMPNCDSLEGTYRFLWLVSRNRQLMKDKSVFPFDKDGDIVFYNPATGQHIQYIQALKTAHVQIARAIAAHDFRVDVFGTYDRDKPDPRGRMYGPNGQHDADRHRPYIERSVDTDVVQGQKDASYPNEALRGRMWQWVQRYNGDFPRLTRPVIRRPSGPSQPPTGAHHHEWPTSAGVYASEGLVDRGVGVPRDPYGQRLGHAALAMPDRNPLIACMSDGPRMAIPPPPAGPAPVIPPPPPGPAPLSAAPATPADPDALEDLANDLAMRLALIRRRSKTSRNRWDDLALTLEQQSGDLASKLPTIQQFVEAEEKRLSRRLSEPPPDWQPEPVDVPPPLRKRLEAVYGDPARVATIRDLNFAYRYYFGEMGELPISPRRRAQMQTTMRTTGEHVYGDTVHRALLHLAPLSKEEEAAKDAVMRIAKQYSLHDFGGHWWALGVKHPKPGSRRLIPSTLRFYVAPHLPFAPQAIEALIQTIAPLVKAGRDVQLKYAQDPREWRGDDGIVVYTGRAERPEVKRRLLNLETSHPEWFREPQGTPMTARLLRDDGTLSAITLAQSSPEASKSVNGPVAESATRAFQWWRLQMKLNRQPHIKAVIDWVARRMQADGRDLKHPSFLAKDQDTGRPGWISYLEIVVRTDQFLSEDVPVVLGILERDLENAISHNELGAQEVLRDLKNFRKTYGVPTTPLDAPELQGTGNGYSVKQLSGILRTVKQRYPQMITQTLTRERSSSGKFPVARFADQSPLMSGRGPWAEDPFTPDPTRAIGFTKAAPGPVMHRMSDGPRGVERWLTENRATVITRLPQTDRSPRLRQSARHDAIVRAARVQGALRSSELPSGDVKLPIEFLWAYMDGKIPVGEEPDGLPIGRVERMGGLSMWRLNRNIIFVRPDNAPQQELISIFFKPDDLPGYPELKKVITLKDLRFLVRERKTVTFHDVRDGIDYPLQITPIYEKHGNGERVSFLVSPPGDFEHGTIIPWRPQWMTSSMMDDLIGAKK